jgi:hypothetical protein
MHEMPMTTAPMRPIVPAERPLLERPPVCAPAAAPAARRGRAVIVVSSVRVVRGTTITGR